MNNVLPKIELYQKRDFGEKVTATFQFVRENWKPLLKYLTILMLPISIVQSLCMNMYLDEGVINVMDETDTDAFMAAGMGYYAVTVVCSVVGGVLYYALFYALFAAYGRRDERLHGITWTDLSADFYRNVRRGFILVGFTVLVVMAYMVVTAMLAFVTPFTLILTLPLLLICAVPLALFYPAYMLGDGSRGVGATFAWSMKQGFHFWGGTFLVTLVCYLLTSIVGGVCSVPWYIVYIFRLLSGMPETDFVSLHGNTFLSVLQFLFGIIMLYGTYLASVVVMLGVTYQYGHIREKTDAVTVTDDIEHFDTL